MSIRTLQELKEETPPGTCLMGLDLGSKTIGLAIADTAAIIASPIETIKRQKFSNDAQNLIKIINERRVGGLVFGLPFRMDGTEVDMTRKRRGEVIDKMAAAYILQGALDSLA